MRLTRAQDAANVTRSGLQQDVHGFAHQVVGAEDDDNANAGAHQGVHPELAGEGDEQTAENDANRTECIADQACRQANDGVNQHVRCPNVGRGLDARKAWQKISRQMMTSDTPLARAASISMQGKP
jgi:hypothetical protein